MALKTIKLNKFDSLSREELLRACLELEDENAKLRPKPAKYKLGQLLAMGNKNPYWNGQPAAYFVALSVENRNGTWFYGYQKSSAHGFAVFAEDKCRALSQTEIDGTPQSQTESVAAVDYATAPEVAMQSTPAPMTLGPEDY